MTVNMSIQIAIYVDVNIRHKRMHKVDTGLDLGIYLSLSELIRLSELYLRTIHIFSSIYSSVSQLKLIPPQSFSES